MGGPKAGIGKEFTIGKNGEHFSLLAKGYIGKCPTCSRTLSSVGPPKQTTLRPAQTCTYSSGLYLSFLLLMGQLAYFEQRYFSHSCIEVAATNFPPAGFSNTR